MASKNKAIDSALAALEKRYGEPVVMRMDEKKMDANTTSSGRPKLDQALGGGYGLGKIIEVYAESGCGKTGLILEAIRVVQESGGRAAIIDAEHALNREYCSQIGVNVDDVYIAQPDYGEQAIEIIRALVGCGEFDIIAVDSVAALTPKAVLEGESGQAHMAVQARMMSQAMSQLKGIASTTGCTLIFTNQLRKTLAMYGPSETTPGGKALKFYATQRLEIKNRGKIKDGSGPDAKVIGFKQEINVVKNKISAPFQIVKEDIIYGKGVDEMTGIIEACVFEGILDKAGSWFKYKGTNVAQGMKKLRETLEDNVDLIDELKEELEKSRQ